MLKGGETLFLSQLPPEKRPPLKPNPLIKTALLYEDSDLLAVNKPSEIPCYPLKETETETVANGIVAQFPEQSKLDPHSWEAGLVQRLDNATSGVLLFARSTRIKQIMMQLNREGKIIKEYQAWVRGKVSQGGMVRKPIAHHPKSQKKMILPRDAKEAEKLKARPALTQYEVLKSGEDYSLLRVLIEKGSRHQIRLHLASLGHPVVGDPLYGEKISSKHPQLLLHAYQVHLRHPLTKKKLTITAPLPEGFKP